MQYVYLLVEIIVLIISLRLIFLEINIINRPISYKSRVRFQNGSHSYLYNIRDKIIKNKYISKIYIKRMNDKKNKELYFIILQLQNIVVSNKNEQTNMNFMIANILNFCKYTKNGFMKFLYYYNLDDRESAINVFTENIPTRIAKDLIYILVEIDYIDPRQIINQFNMLENRVKMDIHMQKDIEEEKMSNFLYILPICLCFLIMLNFVLIVMKEVNNLGV